MTAPESATQPAIRSWPAQLARVVEICAARDAARDAEDWDTVIHLAGAAVTEANVLFVLTVNLGRTVGGMSDQQVAGLLGATASAVNQRFGTRASLLREAMAVLGEVPAPEVARSRPAAHERPECRQVLYRFYDGDGALLYVGITGHLPTRLEQHRREKPWWDSVATVTTESFADRSSVELAERAAIRAEQPLHNSVR